MRIITIVAIFVGFHGLSVVCYAATGAEPAVVLQHTLDETRRQFPASPGVLASVSAPAIALNWSGAAGELERGKPDLLLPNEPFRIASITKVFVAAGIFRLIEDGRLGLYDPIAWHLMPSTYLALREGGYHPEEITVQQLLAHSSGLYDYAQDPAFQRAFLKPDSRHRRWTRSEEIEWAMQHGKPLGKPGERYAYSDTGYILLGEIIEIVSNQSMAAYLRGALRYEQVGLGSTYFETLEEAPDHQQPLAHQYAGVDATYYDPSFDLYGGGGIVSTTADLNRFFKALIDGRVFKHQSTLAAALMTVPAAHADSDPNRSNMLGIVQFGTRMCWAHSGFWGNESLYCPDVDLAVSYTINDAHNPAEARFLHAALAAALDPMLNSHRRANLVSARSAP